MNGNYCYIKDNLFEDVINIFHKDRTKIKKIKKDLLNVINLNINLNNCSKNIFVRGNLKINDDYRLFVKESNRRYKIKIFSGFYIFIFSLSEKINDIHSLWLIKIININELN